MGDSDPALREIATTGDAKDAVLATELRSLKLDVARLHTVMGELLQIRTTLQSFISKAEARDEARREADREYRAYSDYRFQEMRKETDRRFQELRADQAVVETRITKDQASVVERLDMIDARVDSVEKMQAKFVGGFAAAGAIGGAISTVVHLIFQFAL